ncbi:MAG TPA: hypothetical protein VFN41_04595 [Candidatus Limnocylindrales bacterium]|nr:hypothetical protein [Candidatus Limnocylindrales bacterium]
MRRVLASLLLPLLLLGCAGGPRTPTAAPSASASASLEASPSGSFLTVERAALAYSAVADPYNAAIDAAHARYATRQTLEDHQRYWGLLAKADKAFIDGIQKIAFPPELQADADVLIKADTAFQERARAVARARSLAEVISLSAAANDAADVVTAKAAILRKGLGLGY